MSNEERLDELLTLVRYDFSDKKVAKLKAELTKLIEEETTKARIDECEQPCCKHGETTCARREKRLTELKERENSNG